MRSHPAGFRNPYSLGNKVARVLWAIAYRFFFRMTPARWFVSWRNWLLRRFGAKLGKVWIHPRARIWAPWLLEMGDDVYVDEDVYLYNPYGITVGDRVIISLRAFLCSASHDHEKPTYDLVGGKITVGSDCWIAAEAFIGPGIDIGEGSVVGARSSVFKDVPPWKIAVGNPAKPIGDRVLRQSSQDAPKSSETDT